ncbi:glyoxalase [Acrocarpospora phusangensis]|uniref:Glyoxalase n=1 Tax=Acrocarpospora phusangensis TaxID=1070424 RepID=A0A919USC0_9ACTN|nr:VOC family protein [Acrocarpospora phusangensis]GIH28997.1 glyoxalase [Acrocarpospora phusangensis]
MTDTPMSDPSGRAAVLHAYFSYRDAPTALRWLERAFGFTTTFEVPDDKGGIQHAELRLDEVAITVFSDDGDYEHPRLKGETVGHGTYISVATEAAVDTFYDSAVQAGATVVWKPAGTEWGQYRCRVLDIEGYEWTFGTLRPGQSQTDW